MAGVREYSDIDRSWTTFSLVGSYSLAVLTFDLHGDGFSGNSISSISSSEILSTPRIAVFRAIVSLVCFSTIASIILDPKGMTYNLLDYETKLYGPKKITGTTRMSAFTMWSFTLMGSTLLCHHTLLVCSLWLGIGRMGSLVSTRSFLLYDSIGISSDSYRHLHADT